MTVHTDGAPIEGFERPDDPTPRRALGWLARDQVVPQGECPPAVVRVLEEAMRHPVARTRSYFSCPLCPVTGLGPTRYWSAAGEEMLLGDATIEVHAGEVVWRAPSMVLHCIERHRYLPPAAFLSGVERIVASVTSRYLVRRLPDTRGWFGRARARWEVAFVPAGARRAAWVRETATPDSVLVTEGWHPTDAFDALASAKEAWDGGLGRWANVYAGVRLPGLLPASELPEGWTYPSVFLDLLESGSPLPTPWDLLLDAPLFDRLVELRAQRRGEVLVPFADGGAWTACWLGGPGPVVHVSDSGEIGERFASFEEWERAQRHGGDER